MLHLEVRLKQVSFADVILTLDSTKTVKTTFSNENCQMENYRSYLWNLKSMR